jgi:hypothetical protein
MTIIERRRRPPYNKNAINIAQAFARLLEIFHRWPIYDE